MKLTDFNWHNKLKLHRRINVLIYLNPDWEDEWGGFLDIASPDFTEKKSIKPLFNRTLIFSTDDFSFHCHQDPLQCPEEGRLLFIITPEKGRKKK